jgi:hypothetical protein
VGAPTPEPRGAGRSAAGPEGQDGHRTHAGLTGSTQTRASARAVPARVSVLIDGSRSVSGCIRRRRQRDARSTNVPALSEPRPVSPGRTPSCAPRSERSLIRIRILESHNQASAIRYLQSDWGFRHCLCMAKGADFLSILEFAKHRILHPSEGAYYDLSRHTWLR